MFTCGTGSSLRKGGNRSAQEGQSLCSGLVCRWTKKASWKTGTREVGWDWTEEKMGSYCRKEEKSLGCDGEVEMKGVRRRGYWWRHNGAVGRQLSLWKCWER